MQHYQLLRVETTEALYLERKLVISIVEGLLVSVIDKLKHQSLPIIYISYLYEPSVYTMAVLDKPINKPTLLFNPRFPIGANCNQIEIYRLRLALIRKIILPTLR